MEGDKWGGGTNRNKNKERSDEICANSDGIGPPIWLSDKTLYKI